MLVLCFHIKTRWHAMAGNHVDVVVKLLLILLQWWFKTSSVKKAYCLLPPDVFLPFACFAKGRKICFTRESDEQMYRRKVRRLLTTYIWVISSKQKKKKKRLKKVKLCDFKRWSYRNEWKINKVNDQSDHKPRKSQLQSMESHMRFCLIQPYQTHTHLYLRGNMRASRARHASPSRW